VLGLSQDWISKVSTPLRGLPGKAERVRHLGLQKLEHDYSSDVLNSVWVEMTDLAASNVSLNAFGSDEEVSNS
jgi:hypothetical protein